MTDQNTTKQVNHIRGLAAQILIAANMGGVTTCHERIGTPAQRYESMAQAATEIMAAMRDFYPNQPAYQPIRATLVFTKPVPPPRPLGMSMLDDILSMF